MELLFYNSLICTTASKPNDQQTQQRKETQGMWFQQPQSLQLSHNCFWKYSVQNKTTPAPIYIFVNHPGKILHFTLLPAGRFPVLFNLRCDGRVNEWLCHSGRDLCWCHWIQQSSLLLPLCFWPTTVEPNSRETAHTGPLAVCCGLEISVWFTCLSNVFIHGGSVLDVSHGTDYVEMTCLF